LERGGFPRQKVCGEFVSAESLDLLRELLPPAANLLDSAPQIVWARLNMLGRASVVLPITPPAASIARWDLDQSLWQAARLAGADCRERVEVEQVQRQSLGFAVDTGAGTFHGSSVIDASGRWSRLKATEVQTQVLAAKQPHRVGLKAHFEEPEVNFPAGEHPAEVQSAGVGRHNRITTEIYFFPGGYCGVQPTADGRWNVCAMVESARAANLSGVLRLHPALWERSRKWTPVSAPVATAPLVFRAPRADREGVLYSGDAAGFIDPFAGDGISLALRSGVLAAQILAPFWQGRMSLDQAVSNYRNEYQRRYAQAFRTAAAMRLGLSGPQMLQAVLWQGLRLPVLAQLLLKRTR
jgi:flavin-dependent dehydrogenase